MEERLGVDLPDRRRTVFVGAIHALVALGERARRLGRVSGYRLNEFGGDVAEFAVAVLRGFAQDGEGGDGADLALGHDDAQGLVDDRAGGQCLAQLVR